MEKLRQALQTARKQRGNLTQAQTDLLAPATRQRGEAVNPSDSAPWSALRPISLDRDYLIRNRIVSAPSDPNAVPFDVLRTKILLATQKNGWKRLAITSPSPACGKTTIACNLATGFARQTEVKMILFEFDLRHPSMDRMLGIAATGDMEAMLTGRIAFADQAVCIHDTVAISMGGRKAKDSGTLMLSNETLDRLQTIEDVYKPDLMVFDLPPLLVSEDARAFLRNVDCALMVAAAESTPVNEIDVCEREIAEQTNVLGVVLNRCRYFDEMSGYGYGYGYGYENYAQ